VINALATKTQHPFSFVNIEIEKGLKRLRAQDIIDPKEKLHFLFLL